MLFLATISGPVMGNESEYIEKIQQCNREIPPSMVQYSDLYLEHFDFENIDTAVRIGWCESRGKENAYNSGADDSGVMQFIPRTWNWVAEKQGLPRWNDWTILHHGQPYEGPVSRSSYGFEMKQVQMSAYWNIRMASHLAEDTYGYTRWDDWTPSKWCWSDVKKWKKRWQRESR